MKGKKQAATATAGKLQFLYWITAILDGENIKEWVIMDCPEGVTDAEQADAYLEGSMRAMMDEKGWQLVNNYEVTEVGYNLKTPQQKTEERKAQLKVKSKETKVALDRQMVIKDGDSQDVQIQKIVLEYFKDVDDKMMVLFIESFVYYQPNPIKPVADLLKKFMVDQDIETIYLNYYQDVRDINAGRQFSFRRCGFSDSAILQQIMTALLNLAYNRLKRIV